MRRFDEIHAPGLDAARRHFDMCSADLAKKGFRDTTPIHVPPANKVYFVFHALYIVANDARLALQVAVVHFH